MLARVLLIVAGALLCIQLLMLGALFELRRNSDDLDRPKLVRQIATLVHLFDVLPKDMRAPALKAFNASREQVDILSELPEIASNDATLGRLHRVIRLLLVDHDITDRTILLSEDKSSDDGQVIVTVYVELIDGEYLEVRANDLVTLRFLGVPIGFFVGFFGFVVAVIALFAVMREMRPISALARELGERGETLSPLPMPKRKASEVASLVQAINGMQERIARLISNRTLTLGAISHDLKTYLTRLRLRIEMLPVGPQRDRAIEDVEEMQALVQDTLDFAATSFDVTPGEGTDPVSVLRRVVVGHRRADAITLSLPGDLPKVAIGASALQRILLNLIGNGIRYGETVHVQAELQNGGVRILIDDAGPGIPEEEREKVFEPFYRIEASRSRDYGGAGLGLTIVKRLVDAYGCKLTLEKAASGGLRVVLDLPSMRIAPAALGED